MTVAARRLTDGAVIAGLMAASAALSLATIANRPETTNTAFLFQDQGLNLVVADTLLSGGSLYRDVVYLYGPIPAYLHAGFAALFGNTPIAYVRLLMLISCLDVGLAYALMRRAAGIPVATAMTVGGIFTLALIPGSIVGGLTSSVYVPLERTVLLLLALAWEAPVARGAGRSFLLGSILGTLQGVRFGAAAIAGASILLIDVLYVATAGILPSALRAWARSLAAIAAGFIGLELIWIVHAFSTLPAEIASDTVWPVYLLRSYSSWVTSEIRWLQWLGWRFMIVQYLVPLTAGVLGLVGLAGWVIGVRRDAGRGLHDGVASAGAIFIPLCFYGLACFGYFRQVFHFRQFMWALVPAAAWELQRRGATLRIATTVLWAPGAVAMFRYALLSAAMAPATVTVSLPSGGTIAATPALADRIAFLKRFTSTETAGAPVMYLAGGGGWYGAYKIPHATRHVWFEGFDVIRPYEEQAFLEALNRTAALIVCDRNDQTWPSAGGLPVLPFPPSIADAIRQRLVFWTSGAGCRVYHIR
jgi:hypothetical protein